MEAFSLKLLGKSELKNLVFNLEIVASPRLFGWIALRLRKDGYMNEFKQEHFEIRSSFNCIPVNLDPCAAETTPGGFFFASSASDEGYVDGEKSMEKMRSKLFHEWVGVRRGVAANKVAVDVLI